MQGWLSTAASVVQRGQFSWTSSRLSLQRHQLALQGFTMVLLFVQLIRRDSLQGASGQGQQIATGQPEGCGGPSKPASGNYKLYADHL